MGGTRPVPVDIRALRALKGSALALDLYAFVTYRAFRATRDGRAQFVTWEQLMGQLGAGYKDPRNFRKKARATLRKIEKDGYNVLDRRPELATWEKGWLVVGAVWRRLRGMVGVG